jgi:hypothetical protein
MKHSLAIALTFALAAPIGPAYAQHAETNTAFEAGQAARTEGFTAFRAGDFVTALAKMEEALKHRPGNTALLANVIYLAAETGDLARAEEAAIEFAGQGLAPAGPYQAKLKEKLPATKWAEISAMFEEVMVSKGSADLVTELTTDAKLVEGIAYSSDDTLFAATVVSGNIFRLENGIQSLFIDGKPLGMASFFGIKYAPKHNSIFATYARVNQTPNVSAGDGHTGVAEFDAASGALKHNWQLDGSTANHQIADIEITPSGRVFVSDAAGKAVYEIKGDTLTKSRDLPFSISPQGLAELEGTLYLADYGRGIWRLSLYDETVKLLPAPKGVNLLGVDGLTNHNGKLYAIQNGANPHRVLEIAINDTGEIEYVNVLVQALDGFDEPTLGVSRPDGFYFVASSQWPKFGEGGAVQEGITLNPTKIMRLP